MDRRDFLRIAGLAAGTATVAGCAASEPAPGPRLDAAHRSAGQPSPDDPPRPFAADLFRISLAQWSLHRTIRRGDLDPLDFPRHARERYGITAVEYVNQFFMDRARDAAWLRRLEENADAAGVRSLLIMVDGEGALGAPEEATRVEVVERHAKWLDAASALGCHAIRVNAESSGSREEQARLAADGLHRLCERARPHGLHVVVENHGGLSSDGAWLADVIRRADHPLAGTLPDFGNFRVSADPDVWYDRYQGVAELMPFARAVSAKSHAFDGRGRETRTDYWRMMRIVLDAGYRGYVGIEYEGDQLPEHEGIVATLDLLERVRQDLEPEYR